MEIPNSKGKVDMITLAKALMIGGITLIVLWALAKSFGIISSPIWLEMIPVFSGAAALGGVGIAIGKVLNKVDRLVIDVESLNSDFKKLDKKVERLDERSHSSNNRITKMESTLTKKPNSL